ncbi:ABC transporter substrate-binding protein [Moorena sp. SIO3H5]|uniref:ABC transporter substrate-binding protein n=1 Tax=Moorena sp. SIO3H5 TaxID=2607834 RepID=UPI0013BD79C0|nr:ABC transporter substrate-binding protein [Moorena sp. SIO3H5]NEO74050.1 carbohydrate ABC transporter substrate-binding protein [Moorena sp. SIO3H5]
MRRREFNQLPWFFLSLGLANCTHNSQSSRQSSRQSSTFDTAKTLSIWWQQGFYPEETDALRTIIDQWEKNNGIKVQLVIIPQKDILKEIESAIASGNPPDIFYAGVADLTIIPRLAWNNQLVDVSDVIQPLKNWYSEGVLAGVNYQNKVAKKRSYYAVPIMQSAIHIHYWQDILTEIGQAKGAIPRDWQGFWRFWEEVQGQLRQSSYPNMYSIGMPMSMSLDTYNNFEQFLEAYNVKLIDKNGKLRLDDSQVKEGIEAALKQYTRFYINKNVPPDAVDWDNTGNNVTLLSRTSLMTVNHTLSVPGSQRQDTEIYTKQLSTVKWPNKPSGELMRFIIEIKQVILFKASTKQEYAKNFLSYLAQPQNLQAYTEGSQGRYLPVMPKLFEKPFWKNPSDPHISVALQQLQNTRPAYQVLNPAYSEVAAQNVWGEVIRKIVVDNLSIKEATNRAIDQINKIFSNWYKPS